MYHRIAPAPANSLVPKHYVSPETFKSHLKVLERLGRNAFVPADGTSQPLRGIVLSFDDGYANNIEHAVPAMAAAAKPAIIFLVTKHMGGLNEWDASIGDAVEPIMTWDQARTARAQGVTFGSHTCTHSHLAALAPDALRQELVASKEAVERELGTACTAFCYPYGELNPAVRAAVIDAGYSSAYSTRKGAWRTGDDVFTIKRINVRSDTTAALLAYKIFRAVVFDR